MDVVVVNVVADLAAGRNADAGRDERPAVPLGQQVAVLHARAASAPLDVVGGGEGQRDPNRAAKSLRIGEPRAGA